MTDKEKLETLFKEFGIGYVTDSEDYTKKDGHHIISCTEGNEKIDGYGGFFTIFEFDENGQFVEMGAWE